MAVIVSLIKIAVLAAVLTCIGAMKPMHNIGSTQATMSDSKPAHLQCRMYFGCAPVDRVTARTAQL